MKKLFPCLIIWITSLTIGEHCTAQYSGQQFVIMVGNQAPFDLYAEGHADEGEGVFGPYTSIIRKGTSFTYKCENSNAFKGVEGHIRFRAHENEVPGWIDIYFDNPAVGSMTYSASADWPFVVENVVEPKEKRNPNVWISIKIDTAKDHKAPQPWGVAGHSTKPTTPGLIPPVIAFEWEVDQRIIDDDDGSYKNVKYYFTTNGDYAGIKREGDDLSLMIYTPSGQTLLFDDKKKTISVINMVKTVGEGARIGKDVVEQRTKRPLAKDDQREKMTSLKTGNTKMIAGYPADEYAIKLSDGDVAFRAWYAKVPFEPVKAFTMGAGRPADISGISNNPTIRDSPFALTILNKNYLWAETDGGGKKAMETLSIKHGNINISTAGYTIKELHNRREIIQGQ